MTLLPRNSGAPGTCRRYYLNKANGFTLLELIVVCVLIGIMLTISVPSMRSTFFTNPLKSTARQVVGLINEVRQTAVRNQQAYQLRFSQLENRVWYEKDALEEDTLSIDEESVMQKQEIQFPESVSIANVWLHSSGVTSEEQTSIWISKKGYMDQAAIQLTDSGGDSLTIKLNPFTEPIIITEEFPPN
ncbi:Tfp pilus assembly protein FimT/FimU [Desulforhopalus sp. IMCC35007]|uniref:pilus assembly FimT family protein n=1 Tax=Desulforhopalus sp. IMCC35007 TaxID=2569543 RepID=UPI00145D1B55|nr:prepilin-type N-terminal cleavage/methylation domain-containing protein [Desulforhopalus sp. IMCC35007]